MLAGVADWNTTYFTQFLDRNFSISNENETLAQSEISFDPTADDY